MQKTIGEVWDAERPVILVLKPLFCMQKPQMRAGTMETSNSDANHFVLNAKNHRWGLGRRETSYSDANHAVLQAQSDRWWLGPIETCNSGHEVDVLH